MTHSLGLLLLPLKQQPLILAYLLLLADGLLLFSLLRLFLFWFKVIDTQA